MATPIPKNDVAFSVSEILAETKGTLVAPPTDGQGTRGVSSDTRAVAPGELFVALRGTSYDAHDHLAEARSRGASLAIVERDVVAPEGLGVVRVASTLDALGSLARRHVRRWRAEEGVRLVVAITGSAGKTTTRVALSALLEAVAPGEVLATRGNLNNRVGLPMTLFGLDARHRYAVVEIGTNQPGEIAELAAIAEPDAGVVTLVAAAHVEGFGSVDAVGEEKGALFLALPSGGLAVGNGDDARVRMQLARTPAHRRVTYGASAGVDYRIASRAIDALTHQRVRIERNAPPGPAAAHFLEFRTPLLGEAGALAACAAVATVERLLGHTVSTELMSDAMDRADVGGGAGRLVPRQLGSDVVVLDDSYNANPASMVASIRAASEIARATERRLVLVLGEMRELGSASVEGHDEAATAAAASGASAVVAVTGEARRIESAAKKAGIDARFAEDAAAAIPLVLAIVRSGDLVLVKGSRGVATDRVVEALVEKHGEAGEETL
jgi:UDP-N-acetylmuramoyl-tripeptide--D-alanyl-D-alanine ligase